MICFVQVENILFGVLTEQDSSQLRTIPDRIIGVPDRIPDRIIGVPDRTSWHSLNYASWWRQRHSETDVVTLRNSRIVD